MTKRCPVDTRPAPVDRVLTGEVGRIRPAVTVDDRSVEQRILDEIGRAH